MGNYLVNEGVAAAMAQAMSDSVEEDLEERLVRAIEAGTAAGGQPNGQRSAAVLVFENDVYPLVTLRVDDHDTPHGGAPPPLRRIPSPAPLLPGAPRQPHHRLRPRLGGGARAAVA